MEPDDFLAHYGIKGMQWGIRKSKNSSGSSENGETSKWSMKNPKTRNMVIAAASLTTIAVASVVAVKYFGGNSPKVSSLKSETIAKGAQKAADIFDRPTDIIYLGKPHKGAGRLNEFGVERTTLEFISKGGTKDFFQIFDKAGLNDPASVGHFKKMSNGDVATVLGDVMGRVDAATRPIIHTVLIPAEKAVGLNSFEDVVKVYGPVIETRYKEYLANVAKDNLKFL